MGILDIVKGWNGGLEVFCYDIVLILYYGRFRVVLIEGLRKLG